MRLAFALFLLVHGIAHLPGFVVPWRLATLTDMPYKTTLLNGAVDAGPAGARFIGLLWLLAGLGCIATAVAALRGVPGWPTFALGALVLSLVLCALGWPDSRMGFGINLGLLAILLLARPLLAPEWRATSSNKLTTPASRRGSRVNSRPARGSPLAHSG